MEQSYNYEDVEAEAGITLKSVGRFFKKAWLRMVIYVAALVLLATAVAVPIKVYLKSEPVAQTSIEFIYNGIESGLAPDGSVLNTDNIISTTVLASAVKRSNLEKKIKDIATLRNAMRVEGVLTDEYVRLTEAAANGDRTASDMLRNYKMFSTRFNIIISDPSALDLSDDQAKLLLNKIVTCYYEDFQSRYSVSQMFAENSYNLSESDKLEFTDIYDTYLQSLDSVKSYLQQMSETAPEYVSTENNTTFVQLSSDAALLGSALNQFNAYVLSNNIWRDTTAAKNALESNKIDINNRLNPLKSYIEDLTKQIGNYQPNTTTSDNNGTHSVTVAYPADYFVYQARLDEANRQVRDYNIQLNNIETRLEKLQDATTTDDSLKTSATESLATIEKDIVEFIQKVNATVADYYDTSFVSSSVRQVQPPVVTRRSIDFNILIVYVVAVIVGLLAASIVTLSKMNKIKSAEKADKKAAAPAEENESK